VSRCTLFLVASLAVQRSLAADAAAPTPNETDPPASPSPVSPSQHLAQVFAEIARENLEQIIGEKLTGAPLEKQEPESKKTLARRAAGRRGGMARADKLTDKERQDSAKKAAQTRWRR